MKTELSKSTIFLPMAIVFMAVMVVFYLFAQYQINHANQQHHKSITLSDHLRHTSDDLTRMVRTYVITKDPIYKSHFNEILAIRDGLAPRPQIFNAIYWDLVGLDNQRPIPFGDAIALVKLMEELGFTEQELSLLKKAKKNSDFLARIEIQAMRLIEATDSTEQDHKSAIQMLHDERYHNFKKDIMLPIAEFQEKVQSRTLKNIEEAHNIANTVLLFLLFGLMVTVYLLYKLIQEKRHESAILADKVAKRTGELLVAKQQAESANHVKSEFLSSMSHELRTPLNAVIGFTDLMEMDDSLCDDHKENLRQISQSSHHLMSLIQDVLDLSQIEACDTSLELEDCQLEQLIEETHKLVEQQAMNENISISQYIEPDLNIVSDATKIKQILINLFSNAIKYNHPNGAVTIKAYRHGKEVIIDITNTGEGIPNEKLGLLFEPFNRLGKENSNILGTGVGLVITKKLINLLGGSISVSSEVNDHTTFSIRLPLKN